MMWVKTGDPQSPDQVLCPSCKTMCWLIVVGSTAGLEGTKFGTCETATLELFAGMEWSKLFYIVLILVDRNSPVV